MNKLIVFSIMTLALMGCKTIEISNGNVPNEYLAQAKKLEGTYDGSFFGKRGSLEVSFEGSHAVLKYHDEDQSDLLGRGCNSVINDLMWIRGKEKHGETVLTEAGFALDAANCRFQVQGHEVVLSFSKNYEQINVSVLEENRFERTCHWEGGDPRFGGGREYCDVKQVPYYRYGKFIKKAY